MLELQTYTQLFEVERKLYKIFDLELPRPVGLLEAAAFVLTLAAISLVAKLIHLPFDANTAFLFIVPPGLAAWLVSQQLDITDAKRPHIWALAQIRYLLEPRLLLRLEAKGEPEGLDVRAEFWQPLGADWLRRE